MPTITVMAPDSALAMDEVVRQLGDGAYILSTTQQDGMIRIKATNDPMNSAPKRNSLVHTVYEDEEALHVVAGEPPRRSAPLENGQDDGGRNAPSQQTVRPHEERPHLVAMEGGLSLGRDGAAQASHTGDLASHLGKLMAAQTAPLEAEDEPAKPVLAEKEVSGPSASEKSSDPENQEAYSAESISDTVEETLEARLRRVEIALGVVPNSREICETAPQAYDGRELVDAGFDPSDVENALDMLVQRGFPVAKIERSDLIGALVENIVSYDPTQALDADVLFVIGASGSGKTTLAAKFAALLKETREAREVSLVNFVGEAAPQLGLMEHYGRLVDVPVEHWSPETKTGWRLPNSGQTLILDMACSLEAALEILPQLQTFFSQHRIHTVFAVPSGLGSQRLQHDLALVASAAPEVVLTKLDECTYSVLEMAQVHASPVEIGWLAGTRALVGNVSQATGAIMEQYLQETLLGDEVSSETAQMETNV